jgi:RimJ/RimL family protein N-acetyltransferase
MSDYILAPERFEADGFLLRSYLPGDGPLLAEATNSSYEHLRTFMPWAREDQSDAEAEQLARRFRGEWLRGENFVIALLAPDESEVWGGGGFHLREGGPETRNAEMGMWVRASMAGRGLGGRFLHALVAWGFTEWPWLRLSWRCDTRNKASIRVADKAGLKREGTLRSHLIAPDGQRRDTACFSILRDEWAGASP